MEVCLGGVWGTVCDNFFENIDAEVVCRQLGFSTSGARSFRNAFFGEGTGPIFLDVVSCTGNEETLLSCPHFQADKFCRHNKDAGVRCPAPEGEQLHYKSKEYFIYYPKNKFQIDKPLLFA